MSDNKEAVRVTQDALKRLLRDVKSIMKNPLDDQGIYYKHDPVDVLRGMAMIVGPKGTVYEHGFYFFEILYPPNYPHSPPVFKFYTNDGTARLNPNLYKSGKVCLSVLNTWRGEGWTSCQTISSVLVTVCSVLCPKPLLNEPGVPESHRDMIPYETIVAFKNFDLAIAGMLEEGSSHFPLKFEEFRPLMKKLFIGSYDQTLASVEKLAKTHPRPVNVETNIYKMSVLVDFPAASRRLQSLASVLQGSDRLKSVPVRNRKMDRSDCEEGKIEQI